MPLYFRCKYRLAMLIMYITLFSVIYILCLIRCHKVWRRFSIQFCKSGEAFWHPKILHNHTIRGFKHWNYCRENTLVNNHIKFCLDDFLTSVSPSFMEFCRFFDIFNSKRIILIKKISTPLMRGLMLFDRASTGFRDFLNHSTQLPEMETQIREYFQNKDYPSLHAHDSETIMWT